MRFLMDENIPPALRAQLLKILPDTDIWQVGGVGAPSTGTLDPQVLIWCESHDFVLFTNDRKSMPRHLADHLAAGRHILGLLTVNLHEAVATLAEWLKDIAELSLPDEYRDRIEYVP